MLALVVFGNLSAQTYKIDYKGETLANALTKASEQLKIKVAFDAQKASTVHINRQVTGNTPEEFMQNLLSGLSFDYVYKHNRFLLIDKRVVGSADTVSCRILGAITDRESGEQLPYAAVVLPELNMNTYASSSGSFSFKNIQANPFRIVVNFIGYNPVDTLIHWSNPDQSLSFQLKRKVQLIDTVVVNSPRLEMIDFRNDVDFATTINVSKLIDLPIQVETDIFRTLQLLPGISYSENSSELSIHGGSSDQNLILFDGQTLYNLSHYYGMISSLNPNVIKDVQVFKGGFDSRYGERVSGIVDITAKSGNYQRPKIYGDINLLSGNITAEVPVGKKISLVAAFRRTYSDIYSTEFAKDVVRSGGIDGFQGPMPNTTVVSTPSFKFYDYNSKLTFRPNSRESLSVSYYGGKDFIDNSYSNSYKGLLIDNVDKSTWSNFGLSGNWTRQWNNSLFTSLQVGASGYSNLYSNRTLIESTVSSKEQPTDPLPQKINNFPMNDENTLNDLAISLKNSYTLNDRHQLYFGALSRRNHTFYYKDSGDTLVYDNIDQKNWVSSLYFLDRIKLNNVFTVKPGLRVNYYNGTKRIYVEPRLALGADLDSRTSLRMAYGHYCQYISQVGAAQETGYIKNFWVLADGIRHPVINSDHYVIGANFQRGDFIFDTEAYYKSISGIQEYFYISHFRRNTDRDKFSPAPGTENRASYFLDGDGEAYGIDFMLQYKRKSYTGWVSYSISRSLERFDEINFGYAFPSSTDQLHQLSVNNMVSFGKWNFGSIFLFSTGRPYYKMEKDPYLDGFFRYYARVPNYFRTDLSANYAFHLGKSQFKLGASVINVLNTRNYYDINSRDFNFENMSFSQTNLIRSKARSLNLFLHFSF